MSSRSNQQADRRDWVVTLILWIGFTVAVAAAVLTSTRERTVLHAYRLGSDRWLASEPLYDNSGHGFLYLPQAAILFIPWALLPPMAGEIGWRVFGLAVLAAGTAAFSRTVLSPATSRSFLPLITLVTAALCWSSARTGQATILMTGLMLLALRDLSRERWNRAAVWLCLSFAVKPIILPLLLLVFVLWPRQMSGRLVLGGLLTAAFPFLFQRPDYVIEQYRLLPVMLQSASHQEHKQLFTQLFGMLTVLGCQIPDPVPTLLRAGGAGLTLIGAWYWKRQMSAPQFGLFLGSIVACYILLFNPRTESNTYALAGPFLGCALASCWQQQRRHHVGGLIGIILLMVGTFEIGKHFLEGQGNHVLAPAATLAWSLWLIWSPSTADPLISLEPQRETTIR